MTEQPVTSALAVLAFTLIAYFVAKLVPHRMRFRRLQAQGLPMPPHSFLFGHIPLMIRTTKQLPSDVNLMWLTTLIRRDNPELGPDFYLDMWPFAPSMVVVGSPETLHQVSSRPFPKNHLVQRFLRPLTDGLDIVSTNGPQWKKWRTVFNPGFSPMHIVKLTPIIVREVQTFCDRLDKYATNEDIFEMKPLTDNLILDVIGEVVLGVQLNSQKSFSQVAHSLRTQIKWLSSGVENNPLASYNPLRPFMHWYHGRILDRDVLKELDKRIQAWQAKSSDIKENRTITNLALNAYAELESSGSKVVLDAHLRKIISAQVKIFLFAGHDTTSSASCFTFWLLSQNQEALNRLREEHTKVFGSDPSRAANVIAESPYLISQLQYTTAVIKESLRLFPPVTVTKAGEAGANLVDNQGRVFPTENLIVWTNPHSTQRDPSYWQDAESFKPDRWLVGPEDPLYPTKGMWRPFEHGPRNCLGQELAMLEMKIVLVLTSRTYNFKPAYDELDAKYGRKPATVLGTQAYQDEFMQPKGNLPMRIERVKTWSDGLKAAFKS